jgi:hypothetical protein
MACSSASSAEASSSSSASLLVRTMPAAPAEEPRRVGGVAEDERCQRRQTNEAASLSRGGCPKLMLDGARERRRRHGCPKWDLAGASSAGSKGRRRGARGGAQVQRRRWPQWGMRGVRGGGGLRVGGGGGGGEEGRPSGAAACGDDEEESGRMHFIR